MVWDCFAVPMQTCNLSRIFESCDKNYIVFNSESKMLFHDINCGNVKT